MDPIVTGSLIVCISLFALMIGAYDASLEGYIDEDG
jgi:hypothetical protein